MSNVSAFATKHHDAIDALHTSNRCLLQLEGQVARGLAEAKKYIREQRRERALLALRRNKLYEQNLDKIDAYLLNVEQVAFHWVHVECLPRNLPNPEHVSMLILYRAYPSRSTVKGLEHMHETSLPCPVFLF